MPRIPDAFLAELRARTDLVALAQRRVRLTRHGNRWSGLCPIHGEKRPSLSVWRDHFKCFGCGQHGDAMRWVQLTEGGAFRDAVARLAAEAGMESELEGAARVAGWAQPAPPPVPAATPHRAEDGPTPQQRRQWAWEQWERSEPIGADSPVAGYLASRKLWPLPPAAHLVLRATRGRHPDTGRTLHPAMIARIDAPDGTLTAIHRTYLAPRDAGGWGKLGVDRAKMVLGPMDGGAIRLSPHAAQMGVAEGIETALAAQALFGLPVWACVSAGGMEAVQLPIMEVERLVIFADRDKPSRTAPEGRGQQAAQRLERRMRALAVDCRARIPVPPAGDYADIWAARGRGEG